MSGKLWADFLARNPDIIECGRCGLPLHGRDTEAHMRRCIDPAADRSE